MPIGQGPRIIIEIDHKFKKMLYDEIIADGMSMKEWFLKHANEYLESKSPQQSLLDTKGNPRSDYENEI